MRLHNYYVSIKTKKTEKSFHVVNAPISSSITQKLVWASVSLLAYGSTRHHPSKSLSLRMSVSRVTAKERKGDIKGSVVELRKGLGVWLQPWKTMVPLKVSYGKFWELTFALRVTLYWQHAPEDKFTVVDKQQFRTLEAECFMVMVRVKHSQSLRKSS